MNCPEQVRVNETEIMITTTKRVTESDCLLFFKAMADDTRLKIILLLRYESELCVCELTHALQLSQPKISRHIALLKQQQLLSERKSGRWVYYSLAKSLSQWKQAVIQNCFEENLPVIDECLQNLAVMGERPDRVQQCCN
ncbi:transcriptional regulator [Colwellia marinimaniae]|uniref:Transcriptional regulator n=2 Tax=Colwelliaceae TaxID=267889 RepID=A0ABQ0MX28_9GAMM|nr:transcriptional regulator [Colwellia marinimaniae]